MAHASIPLDFLVLSVVVISVASLIGALLAVRVVKPSWLRVLLGLVILVSALRILLNLIK